MHAADDEYVVSSTDSTVLQVHQNDDYGGFPREGSAVVTAPQKGTVEVVGVNMEYTPSPGATGTDSFEYRACNGDGSCDVALVTITFGVP